MGDESGKKLKQVLCSGHASEEKIQAAWSDFLFHKKGLFFRIALDAGLSQEDAKEAVEEGLLALLKTDIRQVDSPTQFVARAIKNKSVDFFRKTKNEGYPESNSDWIDECQSRESSISSQASAKEDLLALRRYLGEKDFELIYAKLALEMTFKEIAERLGISEDQAYSRYKKAIAKAKKYAKSEGN